MEKFVIQTSRNENGKTTSLLTLLQSRHSSTSSTGSESVLKKRKALGNDQEDSEKKKARIREQINEEWNSRESRVSSDLDLRCLAKQSQQKARNYVGWKMDNEGNKVYTTFRNGGKVQVSGQEAFRLALADGKIKPKEKEGIKIYKPEKEPEIQSSTKENMRNFFNK
jgi:hypothetical protein